MPEEYRDYECWRAVQIGIDLFEVDTYLESCILLVNDGAGNF